MGLKMLAILPILWMLQVVFSDDRCSCPPGYNIAKDVSLCYTYRISEIPLNKSDAANQCSHYHKGRLVNFNNNVTLTEWFLKKVIENPSKRNSTEVLWLGVTRQNARSQWTNDNVNTMGDRECGYLKVEFDGNGKKRKSDTDLSVDCGKLPPFNATYFGLACTTTFVTKDKLAYCPQYMNLLDHSNSQLSEKRQQVADLEMLVSENWKLMSVLKVFVACLALLLVMIVVILCCTKC